MLPLVTIWLITRQIPETKIRHKTFGGCICVRVCACLSVKPERLKKKVQIPVC
jgi:hypothetical protein